MRIQNKRRVLLGATVLAAGLAVPAAGMADWIKDMLDERCTPESIESVSGSVRDSIEGSVRRAEASILPPTPVGDLSCLNDLMTAPIDIFSNVGGILDTLQGGMMSPGDLAGGLDIDIAGQVCGMAADKWAELTKPLDGIGDTLSNFTNTASNPLDRIASGGLSNIPGFSGSSSSKDSSGYSGSIDDYVKPSVEVPAETASKPIYPDYNDSDKEISYDEGAIAQAEQAYQKKLFAALGEYIGCRVSANLDGTQVSSGAYGSSQTWNTPNHGCTFSPGAGPIWTFNSSDVSPANEGPKLIEPSPNSEQSSFGQPRPESSPDAKNDASDPQAGDNATGIWDSMITGQ